MRVRVNLVVADRRTGAFITTLDLADALRERGHTVRVNPRKDFRADVTISHLGYAPTVSGKHFLMAHGANARLRNRLPRYDLLWFPSHSLAQWYGSPSRHVVLRPPVRTTPGPVGDHVTLSQAVPAKGSLRFQLFAEALPHLPFLAVKGHPSEPAPPLRDLPNLTVVDRFDDPNDMLALTRVMVMPLGGLSFGRVAVEAASRGIPTIATELGGVREAAGSAVTQVPMKDWEAWVAAIERAYHAEPEAFTNDFDADMAALVGAVEGLA